MAVAPVGAATISVGSHILAPDTPAQQVEISVSGGNLVSGVNLAAQVGDGGPELANYGLPAGTDGPAIAAVDLTTGTIFGTKPATQFPMGDAIPQFVNYGLMLTEPGESVAAQGLLVTLTIDTSGFSTGTWDLLLGDVLPELGHVQHRFRPDDGHDHQRLDHDGLARRRQLRWTGQRRRRVDPRVALAAGFRRNWFDGDFNGDGQVNDADAAILAAHWGTGSEEQSTPSPNRPRSSCWPAVCCSRCCFGFGWHVPERSEGRGLPGATAGLPSSAEASIDIVNVVADIVANSATPFQGVPPIDQLAPQTPLTSLRRQLPRPGRAGANVNSRSKAPGVVNVSPGPSAVSRVTRTSAPGTPYEAASTASFAVTGLSLVFVKSTTARFSAGSRQAPVSTASVVTHQFAVHCQSARTVGISPCELGRPGHLAGVEVAAQLPPQADDLAKKRGVVLVLDHVGVEPADLLAEDELLAGLHPQGEVLRRRRRGRPGRTSGSPRRRRPGRPAPGRRTASARSGSRRTSWMYGSALHSVVSMRSVGMAARMRVQQRPVALGPPVAAAERMAVRRVEAQRRRGRGDLVDVDALHAALVHQPQHDLADLAPARAPSSGTSRPARTGLPSRLLAAVGLDDTACRLRPSWRRAGRRW